MASNEKFADSTAADVISKDGEQVISPKQDEALKVLYKEHGSDEWDAREETSLRWKIDRKLFSIILLSYVCR